MSNVEIFNQIRDFPYRIPLSDLEPNDSCSGKVMRLKKALDEAGLTTRYRVCDFKWSDLPLPDEVLCVPHSPAATHVYLEVQRGDSWISIDPTWDTALSSVFPIASWDGISSTSIAVAPLKLFSDEESRIIMEEPNAVQNAVDLQINRLFYQKLNHWLEQQRNIG
jgi:hypothetical protein